MFATMTSRWSRHSKTFQKVSIVASWALLAWALCPLALVLYVAFRRLDFPFDLEWCEGGSLYQAYRLLHGLPLYTRSDPSWAPFPYPPAHTLVLALLGLIRLDFWMGRLASIALFLFMGWVLFREVYEHAGGKRYTALAGAFGLSVIACAYPVTGQWYDLVRVDSMMMALCVWGTARVLRPIVTKRSTIATALIFTVAIFTKQLSTVFVGWACLFALFHRPKFGLALGGVTLVACGLTLAFAQWITGGGFWFWVITNLARQTLNTERLKEAVNIILQFAPFILAIPVVFLLLAAKRALSAKSVLWTGSLLLAVPTSLLPYAKSGGYLNNLMPMLVLLGPVTMILASDLANVRWAVPGYITRGGTIAAMVAFVALRPMNYQTYLPDANNRRAAANLNAMLRTLKGGLVSPYFAFLPARTGHTNPHWHRMVVLDAYYRGDNMSESDAFERSGARWALLLSAAQGPFESYVRNHLNLAERLPADMHVYPVTGERALVDELWQKM